MSDSQDVPPPPVPPIPPSVLPPIPPSDGRVPPPWEASGPAVQRFVDTIRGVLLDPTGFFARMSRQGGLGAPLIYAVIGILLGSIGSYLTTMMLPFGGWGSYGDYGGFAFSLVFVPVVSVIALFIGAGLLHILLVLVASTKHPFETSFRVVTYTLGSTSVLNIIPFLGGLIGTVWGLVVLILGTHKAHEVSQAHAAIAVLLPSVICCGIGVLFAGSMLALMFGAAAAGMR